LGSKSRNNPFKAGDRGGIRVKWSSREEKEWYRWGREAMGEETVYRESKEKSLK